MSGEIDCGRPLWAAVKSVVGGVCRIVNPWPSACVYVNSECIGHWSVETIELETVRGDLVVFAPDEDIMAQWETIFEEFASN